MHGAVGQGLVHRQQGLQLTAAVFALGQMEFERGHLFIRQLAVGDKDDILLRFFALHFAFTSTSLKISVSAVSYQG